MSMAGKFVTVGDDGPHPPPWDLFKGKTDTRPNMSNMPRAFFFIHLPSSLSCFSSSPCLMSRQAWAGPTFWAVSRLSLDMAIKPYSAGADLRFGSIYPGLPVESLDTIHE